MVAASRGGDQPRSRDESLRHDQPIEGVATEQFREIPDRLGMTCRHVQESKPLLLQAVGQPGRYVAFPSMALMVSSHTVATET